MSKSEDYLDNLLNSVTKKFDEMDEDFEQKKGKLDPSLSKRNLPPKTARALEEVRENQFLRDFERELGGENTEDLMAEFEARLDFVEDDYVPSKKEPETLSDEDYFSQVKNLMAEDSADDEDIFNIKDLGDLDDLEGELPIAGEETVAQSEEDEDLSDLANSLMGVGDASEGKTSPSKAKEKSGEAPPEGMEALTSLFDDLAMDVAEMEMDGDDLTVNPMATNIENTSSTESADEEFITEPSGDLSDEEILAMLGAGDGTDGLSDITQMLEGSAEVNMDDDSAPDKFELDMDDIGDADGESGSHAAKVVAGSTEEPEEKPEKKKGFLAKLMEFLFGEDEDDEELEGGATSGGEDDEALAALEGKKEKKEKKEKPKKEKPKKEPKPPKPPKPKKEKPVKEPEPKGKPLPKVPVILIAVLAISLLAFLKLGSDYVGEAATLVEAREKYDSGNYADTYALLAKGKYDEGSIEEELYQRSRVLAVVESELTAYNSMMKVKQYGLALDCLIRGLGRYDMENATAEEWGVESQMKKMGDEIVKQLKDQFNVTPERAREIYDAPSRREYSKQINEILKELGLMEY